MLCACRNSSYSEFAPELFRLELGDVGLRGVARQRRLADAAVIIADFVGAGEQVIARLAEQPFGRGDARLQRLEADARAVALVLVALVGFLERGGEPARARC